MRSVRHGMLTRGVLPTAPVKPSTAREVNVLFKWCANLRDLNMVANLGFNADP